MKRFILAALALAVPLASAVPAQAAPCPQLYAAASLEEALAIMGGNVEVMQQTPIVVILQPCADNVHKGLQVLEAIGFARAQGALLAVVFSNGYVGGVPLAGRILVSPGQNTQ